MDIDKLYEMLKELEEENKNLKERCFKLSKGAGCDFCPYICSYRKISEGRNMNIVTDKDKKEITLKFDTKEEMAEVTQTIIYGLKERLTQAQEGLKRIKELYAEIIK